MAKTIKERVSDFRRRVKDDPAKYEAYKLKDRQRKQKSRKREKESAVPDPVAASRKRKLNRERVRRHRSKKKREAERRKLDEAASEVEKEENAYKTPQALGRALGRVKPVLPHSPRKRKAVVMKLASSEGISVAKKMRIEGSPNHIPADTVKLVTNFFLLDSISRQAPGKRDFVTIRKEGGKEHVQKRHLMWSLEETYGMFKKENSSVKIGFSKFCSLRPQNVLLLGQYPHQACLCSYHENMRLLCDCLSKSVPDFPSYSSQFVDFFVCSPDSDICMLGQCENCPRWLKSISAEDLSLMVTWYQWERVVQKINGEEKSSAMKKMEKVCKEGTVEDALEVLQEKLPQFLRHVYIKRQQTKYFEMKLEHLQADEAVIQVDFSENYACLHQDEPQTAHWSQEQVTIFPVAIWTTSDDESQKSFSSHALVTDNKSHDKKVVAIFMDRVIKRLISEKGTKIKHVHIFSDGPSSQFKNKYMVNFYQKLRLNVELTWHFFATSHGKGVVDGIGGTVKRVVWRAVSSRRVPVVANALSFADVAAKLCKSVNITFISSDEINRSADLLDLSTCFQEAVAVPGISKYHCIEPQKNGQVRFRIHSFQSDYVVLASSEQSKDSESDDEDCVTSSGHSELERSDIDEDFEDEMDHMTESLTGDDDANDMKTYDGYDNGTDKESEADDNEENDEDISHVGIAVPVQHCLPKDIQLLFDISKPFTLPYHLQYKADAIANSVVPFNGHSIIQDSDIKALLGESSVEEENWLNNFVIDEHLDLMATAHSKEDFRIKTILWERFERAVGIVPANEIWNEKDPLWSQDIVFIPCNSQQSEHWFGLAVRPKQKQVLSLDSMAGDFLKPTVQKALFKVASFLVELDDSVDLSEWSFYSNRKDDLPQQSNLSDCGLYTCLYARSLFSRSPCMINRDHTSSLMFRKCMIIELHTKSLLSPKALATEAILCEKYYAVEYEKKFYIGRAVRVDDNTADVKFLHQTGVGRFDWPLRSDVDTVYKSRIFHGPTALKGNRPFEVPNLSEIKKLFQYLRKRNAFQTL